MPKSPESIGPKNSTAATSRTNGTKSFEQLTKKQLIELLEGNITQPLTPEGLYRCAVSALGKGLRAFNVLYLFIFIIVFLAVRREARSRMTVGKDRQMV